ncbi:MAG TPA: general secretion pathway protein GspG, partial [Phycisphaerales bacterium]|nr:general secretion pathway protein GspG [Phycisphaerales bacterium]
MRPAFTLVELIVVVALLGIIGAVAAPRLMRSGGRLAESEARGAAALIGR